MADEINVGSVSVEVVPDAGGWSRKLEAQIKPQAEKLGQEIGKSISDRISEGIRKGMTEGFAGSDATSKRQGSKAGDSFGGSFARDAKARIKAALSSLPEAEIGVATSKADQELKDLKARLATLSDKTVGIDISDTEALAEMQVLEVELARLGSESPNIQVQVDTARASAELAAFRVEMSALTSSGDVAKVASGFSGIGSSLASGVSGLAAMIPLVIALGVALIPVVASVAGLVGMLAAPLAAAGGGLTLFAILGGKAIANTLKTSKAIDELRKKAATLQDPKAAKAAAAQADALEKSLTKPQQAFLKAKAALSKSFGGLLGGKTGAALFAPIVAGMNLLAKILPKLSPVIEAVSTSITGLLDSLGKKVSGDGFTKFVKGFADLAGSSLTALGKIAGNLGVALGNIFGAFAPAGQGFLDTLVGMSDKFEKFTEKASTQKGIRDFIDYVKRNGPVVAEAFGRTIAIITRVMIGLSDTGAFLVRAYDAVAGVLRKLPTQAFVGAIGAVIGIVKTLGSNLSGIRTKVGQMVTAFLNAPGRILGALSILPATLYSIGHNAIALFARGIESAVGAVSSAVSKVLKATGPLGGLAGKIPGFANGTRSAPGGLAVVGENGPELVHLPRGSRVDPKLPKGATPSSLATSNGMSKRDLISVLNGLNITLNGQPARLGIMGG